MFGPFMSFQQAQAARGTKWLLQQALLTHAIARRRRLVILVCCLISFPFSRLSERESSASETFLSWTGGKVLLNDAIFSTHKRKEVFLCTCVPLTRNWLVHFYNVVIIYLVWHGNSMLFEIMPCLSCVARQSLPCYMAESSLFFNGFKCRVAKVELEE